MDNSGSSFNSDGSITYSNGNIVSSEGATFFNNGTIKFSDGAVLHKDLQIIHTDGTVVQGELFEEDTSGVKEAEDPIDNVEGEAVVDAGSEAETDEEDKVDTALVEEEEEEEDEEADVAGEGTKEAEVGEKEGQDIYNGEDLETFEVVGTLDLGKITELWTAQRCEEVASGSSNCTLLNYLKNATLLMQLMEALTAEDGPSVNTWSDIVQLMHSEGMTPDANSYMETILAQDRYKQGGEGGRYSSGVLCDHGDLSCRDGLACYPKTSHCDLEADCRDFSDEDSCSCKDRFRLIIYIAYIATFHIRTCQIPSSAAL